MEHPKASDTEEKQLDKVSHPLNSTFQEHLIIKKAEETEL